MLPAGCSPTIGTTLLRTLAVLSLLFLTPGCGSPPAAREPRKPNFVLILSDDAGYADFGFQGSATHATPHVDSIANDGIRFAQAYVTSSVCSPSRAGMLTGRNQQRFGHEYNLPGVADPAVPNRMRGLPLTETTVADLLKQQGYATGLVGKWHLGQHASFHPQKRGFDEFWGIVGGSSPYLTGSAKAVVDGDTPVPAESLPYLTDAIGDRAAAFVEKHRDEPFFLYVAFNAPHTPLEAREADLAELRPQFETKARAVNAAMTRALDENVGKVLAAIDRAGIAEDTLVVFANDNGGAMPYSAALNSPLRGTKGTFLEGGIRVPMAMRWPARLPAGTTYAYPVSTLDLLPTMVAAAGGRLPIDREYDGLDLVPHLTGAVKERPHRMLYWRIDGGAAIRQDDWKLVRTPDRRHWLFDLSRDVSETTDLTSAHPGLAQELRAALEAWEATLAPPIWRTGKEWEDHSLIRYDQSAVDGFVRR